MDNIQRINFLKNPHLLFQSSQGQETQIELQEGECKDYIVTTLKTIHNLIESDYIPEAESILQALDLNRLGITTDKKGWLKYFYGCIYEKQGNINDAIEAYLQSSRLYSNGWPFYRLGQLHELSNPISAFSFYTLALSNPDNLSEEAILHAERWCSSFYSEEIYKRFNPDLTKLNIDLLGHYIEFGYSEGRIGGHIAIQKKLEMLKDDLPLNFDWKLYLEANIDLESLITAKTISLLEAEYIITNHYIEYGKMENRPLINNRRNYSSQASEEMYDEFKGYISRQSSRALSSFLQSNKTIRIRSRKESKSLVTVIMVLFNKAELTFNALKGLRDSSTLDISLVIVDNNSTDRTKELLERLEGNVSIISNPKNLHFLESVNMARTYVKTEYIALLNNDAVLDENALEEAVECIQRYSDHAIIGGKVLHFDGYIQDAGSIVFSDGSCKGLGRRFTPNHHLFNFERQVDYVSGAFFFTTKRIFDSLKGFNEKFKPAYYEESDLCFRARASGIPIIYNPNIVIKHLEFGSATKSENAIQLMKKNQLLFKQEHNKILNKHLHPALYKEEDISCVLYGHLSTAPKVLIIEDRIPSPELGSGFSRSYQLVLAAKAYSSHVTLFATDYLRSKLTTHDLPRGVECIEGNKDHLIEILTSRSSFYEFIFVTREHNQRLFDCIIAELKAKEIQIKSTIVYDAESLFSIRDYTKEVLLKTGRHISSISMVDVSKIVTEELRRFQKADIITTVSTYEKEIIKKALPEKKLYLLGHPFQPIDKHHLCYNEYRSKIVFLGAFHEEDSPNHDSLIWLYQHILPELQQRHIANLQIVIAGYVTCEKSLNLIQKITTEYPTVNSCGLVEDLAGLFAEALLFLAPTRYAAGVPHKVHMAASYGVPALTTNFVAEQLGWKQDGAILIADTPKEYADQISNAYSNPKSLLPTIKNMIAKFNVDCSASLFNSNLNELMYESVNS